MASEMAGHFSSETVMQTVGFWSAACCSGATRKRQHVHHFCSHAAWRPGGAALAVPKLVAMFPLKISSSHGYSQPPSSDVLCYEKTNVAVYVSSVAQNHQVAKLDTLAPNTNQ